MLRVDDAGVVSFPYVPSPSLVNESLVRRSWFPLKQLLQTPRIAGSSLRGYAIAVVLVAASVALRFALEPWLTGPRGGLRVRDG